jgi:predicted glycosyltransferase
MIGSTATMQKARQLYPDIQKSVKFYELPTPTKFLSLNSDEIELSDLPEKVVRILSQKIIDHEDLKCLSEVGFPIERYLTEYEPNLIQVRMPDEKALKQRKLKILEVYDELGIPDTLILELWPFGRGYYNEEIQDLVTKLREKGGKHSKVYSLLRDFPSENPGAILLANELLDGILQCNDERLYSIQKDPRFRGLKTEVRCVGLWLDPLKPANLLDGEGHILFSPGSSFKDGAEEFLNRFIKSITKLKVELPVKIIIPSDQDLADQCPGELLKKYTETVQGLNNSGLNIEIISLKTGGAYRDLVSRAKLIVTRGGNTVVEAASLAIPTISVPHYGKGNLEQLDRVRTLKRAYDGIFPIYTKDNLNNSMYFEALIKMCLSMNPGNPEFNFDAVGQIVERVSREWETEQREVTYEKSTA